MKSGIIIDWARKEMEAKYGLSTMNELVNQLTRPRDSPTPRLVDCMVKWLDVLLASLVNVLSIYIFARFNDCTVRCLL